MLEEKIRNGLIVGGLMLGISNCAPSHMVTRTALTGDTYQCSERRNQAGAMVSDECSFLGGEVFETNYGPDGPGNGNDERRYFSYFTRDGNRVRPGEHGYGQPWNKRTAGIGGGDCQPTGGCSQEAF